MTEQDLHALLKQAEDDYDMMIVAGPNSFETEEEYNDALEKQYGVIYTLVETLSGRYPDL